MARIAVCFSVYGVNFRPSGPGWPNVATTFFGGGTLNQRLSGLPAARTSFMMSGYTIPASKIGISWSFALMACNTAPETILVD